MKAMTLRKKILDLRSGQQIELECEKYNMYIIAGGDDEGWWIAMPGSALIIRFNEIRVSGNDIYLVKEDGDDSNDHIFAAVDAGLWEVMEDKS